MEGDFVFCAFTVVHHMPSSGELGRICVDLLRSLWFNLFLQLRSRGEIHWKMAALHFSIPYQYRPFHCISGEWRYRFRILRQLNEYENWLSGKIAALTRHRVVVSL